jgi:hypothetical protein
MAKLVTAIHLLWILFMLLGFFWTLIALFAHRRFFDFFWFSTLHLAGILFVATLALMQKYCPLTILENYFRQESDAAYAGGFIRHYLEKLVYPDVNPLIIQMGTLIVTLVSVAAYLLRPPERTKNWVKRILNR